MSGRALTGRRGYQLWRWTAVTASRWRGRLQGRGEATSSTGLRSWSRSSRCVHTHPAPLPPFNCRRGSLSCRSFLSGASLPNCRGYPHPPASATCCQLPMPFTAATATYDTQAQQQGPRAAATAGHPAVSRAAPAARRRRFQGPARDPYAAAAGVSVWRPAAGGGAVRQGRRGHAGARPRRHGRYATAAHPPCTVAGQPLYLVGCRADRCLDAVRCCAVR